MAFRGWPVEAIEFYEELEDDNTKAFWTEHKATYENYVRAPMQELIAELAPEFGDGKVFRPYRDTRFSGDKSPYKTNIGTLLAGGGYVQLDSVGLAVGTGLYHPAKDQLDRYRKAVADDTTGPELEAVIARVEATGCEVLSRESLKTAPRGYPKDHPRIELLRHKGLIAWKQWEAGAWLGTAKAKTRIVDFLRNAQPLMTWFDTYVGDSELESGWR